MLTNRSRPYSQLLFCRQVATIGGWWRQTMTTSEGVDRLLAAARDTMAKVTDCWAATPSADGGVSVRVVMPIAGVPGEDDWTIWFATGGGSRKAGEIRRAGRLTLRISASSRSRLCRSHRPSRTRRRQSRNSRPVAREMAGLLPGRPRRPQYGFRQGECRAHRILPARRLAGAIRFAAFGARARCGSPVECRLRLSVRPSWTAASKPRRSFMPNNFPDRRRAGASPPLCGCGDA